MPDPAVPLSAQSDSARCAVIAVNLATEATMWGATFTDDGTGLDPHAKCEAFWRSIKADWPGWEPSYVMNDAARELMKHRRMWGMGFTDNNPMTARIEAHNAEVDARA